MRTTGVLKADNENTPVSTDPGMGTGLRTTNADVNARRCDTGHSILDMAAAQGYTEAIEITLARGADVNATTPDGRTALHCASYWDQVDAIDLLVESGARLEATDARGCTPLHVASATGAAAAATTLMGHGADKNKINSDGRSPLLVAAEHGHLAAAAALLHASEEDDAAFLNRRYGSDEYTALDLAARGGHQQILEMIIRHGCDVNAGDSDGVTALYLAALNDQPYSIDVLVEAGGKVNARSHGRCGWTALHVACAEGSNLAVRALLRRGASQFDCDSNSRTPLHLAVQNGQNSTVKMLLGWGSDPTFFALASDFRYSALDVAASLGNLSALRAMCEHVRIKKAWDAFQQAIRTALSVAAIWDQVDVIKWLIFVGANVNGTGNNGRTALHKAAFFGRTSAAQALLAAGACVSARYRCGKYYLGALDIAAKYGHEGVMRAVIQYGGDVNDADDATGSTALHVAGAFNQVAAIHFLVDYKSNVDAADSLGSTPLHDAAANNSGAAIAALAKYRADVNRKNSEGETPLHVAVSADARSRLDAVKALLASGADIAIRSGLIDEKYTALDMAAKGGHVDVIAALIEAGGFVEARDADGTTALMHAVKSNKPNAVDALAEAGADVEAHLEGESWTPLHSAAEDAYPEVVRVLLKHRADVHAKDTDNFNDTPLHVAVRQAGVEGAFAVVKELLMYGADEEQKNESGLTPAGVVGSNVSGDATLPMMELLARAPADRAWRRRGLLILCCARSKKEEWPDSEKGDDERRARGEGLASSGTRGGAGREQHGRRGSSVAAWLTRLPEEGLFRAIVGFL